MVFFADFEGYFPALRVISVGCPFAVVYCPSPWFTEGSLACFNGSYGISQPTTSSL